MKAIAVLRSLALVAFSSTHARECLTSDESDLLNNTDYVNLRANCLDAVSMASLTPYLGTDPKEWCTNRLKADACYAAIDRAIANKIFPACNVGSKDLPTTFSDQVVKLKALCKDLVGTSSASSASTATRSAAVTGTVIAVLTQLL